MEFSHQVFFLSLLLPLVTCTDPIYHHCVQKFTNNNILQGLITRTINSMIVNTPKTGHTITTVATGSDIVYGLTRCRGDIGQKACLDCITAASQDLQAICPDTSASRIWYDFCSLRYGTINFLGTIDNSILKAWINEKEAKNPIQFSKAVLQLLHSVKTGAATAITKFRTGKKSFNSNASITIYGMAQCTRDLQGIRCMKCLEELTSVMKKYCTTRIGCHYMSSSCLLRFEIYNFLLASTIPT